ncbi:hypothetical protein SAMN05421753_104190 [Planctomicrobium piriforme]|uniref:Uncharacterized protein n=1 Tax=Planctomicrobium piriforme TaxID=1576369 RepID=A0A1I3EEP8_9PLAN|nr:hypothetical protein SAMN05421753_104190 [Planctomicrobium piriforme]
MRAEDWSGSGSQRKNAGNPCLYPHASRHKSLPQNYFVPAGTPALFKKVGDSSWRPITTKRENIFDDTYRSTQATYVFFSAGNLLCVKKNLVQRQPQVSDQRQNLGTNSHESDR